MMKLSSLWIAVAVVLAIFPAGIAKSFANPNALSKDNSPQTSSLQTPASLSHSSSRFASGTLPHADDFETTAVRNTLVEITCLCDGNSTNDSCNSNFGMGAYPAGDHSDQNIPLTFGWKNFDYIGTSTTISTIWIEGEAAEFGDAGLGTIDSGPESDPTNLSITSVYTFRNVQVTQIFTIVSILTGLPNTAQLTYIYTNQNSSSVDVGLRILIDDLIGNNDGAPIYIPGVTYSEFEQNFEGAAVPAYWEAFEGTVADPEITAKGTLTGAEATLPDRFAVCYYPNTEFDDWNYTTTPTLSYIHPPMGALSDSAVSMWWYQKPLAPGASLTFTTYYGLGTSSTCVSDFQVNVSAPETLSLQNCALSPNPFPVILALQDQAGYPADDVQATITLPPGLQLVGSNLPTVQLGNLDDGVHTTVTWNVLASGIPGDLTMQVAVTSSNTSSCEVDRNITIPVPCTPTPLPTGAASFTPTPTPSPVSTFTPTATPNRTPPFILAAGYGTTSLSSCEGGALTMYAWVRGNGMDEVQQVQLLYNGNDTGLRLLNNGQPGNLTSGDGIYTFSISDVGSGIAPGQYLFELSALDTAGNQSLTWPYFTIQVSNQGAFAPRIPDFRMDMAEFLHRPAKAGGSSRAHTLDSGGGPIIFGGGYMTSTVTGNAGGQVDFIIVTAPGGSPVDTVQMYYNGSPTGVDLLDNGQSGDFAANDGIYGLLATLSPPLNPGQLTVEALAEDAEGNQSALWPYLTVNGCSPTPTETPSPSPTLTPTLTPTHTPYPTPCFTLTPSTGVINAGDYIYVDASCSVVWEGSRLRFMWGWGDNTPDTNWSSIPTNKHVYSTPANNPYIITLWAETDFGHITSTTEPVRVVP